MIKLSIASGEILPNVLGYDMQRRDRPKDAHRGELIAAKRCFMLSNIYCVQDVELISGVIKLDRNKFLTVVSYYRPPNRTDDDYMYSTTRD